jgi:hypothetical protein
MQANDKEVKIINKNTDAYNRYAIMAQNRVKK